MQQTSAELLEYESLRRLLGRFVHSPLGLAELERLQPSTDRASLVETFAVTAESLAYLKAVYNAEPGAVRPRFDSLPDVAVAVELVRIEGAVLDPRQIFDLTKLLDRAADIRSALAAASVRFPRLGAKAVMLADLRALLRDLRGKILPDGSVADDASVALVRLRRDMERQQRHIQISLDRFLRAHHEDGTLQEDFVTIRNDRFVVPIVSGQQRKVQGVIHGSSGSGHTLFVEPLDTIELNNDLVRLREEEMREVHRILRELTQSLREHSTAIATTVKVIGELELLFAKAQYAIDFSCIIPTFSPDANRRLALVDARHPLLEDVLRRQNKPIAPISLTLAEDRRTLLISGPNTGGKTVSMKTVGLFVLMAQSGLPLPAASAELPIFDQVLADIGDNQSISESLSTFSAHIAHIRTMVEAVTRDSLVLLDELGRATDPEEGGALGVSILDTFRRNGAFTIASTHLLALKVYGANTAGVLNGSMGFDDQTLQPTYVLRLGAPGKSAGLDIASRLGLPAELIAQARANMSGAERDIARFLGELHARLDAAAALELDLRQKQQALDAREQSLAKEWERRESAKLKEIERRYEAAIAEFEMQARETLAAIQTTGDQRKAAEQAQRRVSKTRREFTQQIETTVLAGTPAEKPPMVIVEGCIVRLRGIREPARVRRVLPQHRVEVEAGLMKMQVPLDDIVEVLPAAAARAQLPRNVSFEPGPTWDVSYREINVIGQRAEEACGQVDKFLDSASMASVDRVRIIHGHGMGILKRAIADLLTHHPHVEKFFAGSPAEGGAGATVVELK